MTADELEGGLVGGVDQCGVAATEAVLAVRDGYEFVLDAMLSELLGHHDGLLVRDISVTRTVDEHCRWVVDRDVADGHVGDILVGFGVRVPTRNGLRPDAVLAAVLVEGASITCTISGVRNRRATDLPVGYLAVYLGALVPFVWAGRAVPIADQIAVSVEGDEHSGRRLNAEAGRKCEVSPAELPMTASLSTSA